MLVAIVALVRNVPAALAPAEDQGYVMVIPILQDAASLKRTEAVNAQLTEALLAHPAVAEVMTFSGLDVLTFSLRTNTGITWSTSRTGANGPPRNCRRRASPVTCSASAPVSRTHSCWRSSRRRSRASA